MVLHCDFSGCIQGSAFVVTVSQVLTFGRLVFRVQAAPMLQFSVDNGAVW